MKKLFTILIIVLTSIQFTSAQDDWKISGSIQLRSAVDGRDFSNKTHALTFASLRTRVGVSKTIAGKLNFCAQVQDSRVFGEEPNTLASTDNLDLHQGFIKLLAPLDIPADIQAGRFEVAYGTERFFGAVGWHYVGRSWDGLRLSFKTDFDFDLFALTHSESNVYIANAVPAIYPLPAVSEFSQSVYGFWTTFKLNQQNRLDAFGYYNKRRNINQVPEDDVNQFTVGANHVGTYGAFSTITEAAYQFGDVTDIDLAAYLFSLQAFYTTGNLKLGAGADILSGTDPASEKINSFSVDFGTNHKFYGFMDYFINIPGNTFLLGLNDFYASISLQGKENPWSGSLVFHHFNSNKPSPADQSAFGQEIDLTLKYDIVPGTSVSWGGSLFLPGELMKSIFNTPQGKRDDTAFWSYIMISAVL